MSLNSSISFYFPDLASQQLLALDVLSQWNEKHQLKEISVDKDWQQEFCKEIGLSRNNLPWNQLRALQFDIDLNTQTAVCCDPVMMQMTHRGAYLWGQSQLEFSNEEVIRIIAQINQQLMGDDECFYLMNNHQWLYTNKNAIELKQPSFEEYIGKDMFGFSYNGSHGVFWDKLATEIQMLIKQMMDYQGLTSTAPEMIVNVHFWGNTDNKLTSTFEMLNNENLHVLSSGALIGTFCKNSNIEFSDLTDYKKIISESSEFDVSHKVVFISNNENIDANQLINEGIEYSIEKGIEAVRFVVQDKVFLLNRPKGFWQKLLSVFR